MKKIHLTIVVVATLFLTACGQSNNSEAKWFRDRQFDYLHSDSIAAIELPPSTNEEAIVPLYPIPAGEIADGAVGRELDMSPPPDLTLFLPDEAADRELDPDPTTTYLTLEGDQAILIHPQDFPVTWEQVNREFHVLGYQIKAADIETGRYTIVFRYLTGDTRRYWWRFWRKEPVAYEGVHVLQLREIESNETKLTVWDPDLEPSELTISIALLSAVSERISGSAV